MEYFMIDPPSEEELLKGGKIVFSNMREDQDLN
jgi:hypothetical protein